MLTFLSVIYILLITPIVWRLRGGALKTFLKLNVGTNVTRLLTMSFLGGSIALLVSELLLFPIITFALMLGLVLSGWGPYMGMGRHVTPASPSWIDFFPKMFKLIKHTRAWDFAGLSFCGFILFLPFFIATAVLINLYLVILLPVFSLLFASSYALANKLPLHKFPIIPNFVSCFTDSRTYQHEEWAEIFVGVVVALALCLFLL